MSLSWSEANEAVWAVVSGLPSPERERRLIAVFQCFVDESGYGSDDVMVVAGVIAPAGSWAKFSDRWKQVCKDSPPIGYFKMNELATGSGEFQAMPIEFRRYKFLELSECIHEHIPYARCFAVPVQLYKAYINDQAFEDTNLYKFIVYWLISEVSDFVKSIDYTEKVEFIFDDTSEQMKVLLAWDEFMRESWADTSVIGSNPVFRNDKAFLPLQAADYFAWDARNAALERLGHPTSSFRWNSPANRERGTT